MARRKKKTIRKTAVRKKTSTKKKEKLKSLLERMVEIPTPFGKEDALDLLEGFYSPRVVTEKCMQTLYKKLHKLCIIGCEPNLFYSIESGVDTIIRMYNITGIRPTDKHLEELYWECIWNSGFKVNTDEVEFDLLEILHSNIPLEMTPNRIKELSSNCFTDTAYGFEYDVQKLEKLKELFGIFKLDKKCVLESYKASIGNLSDWLYIARKSPHCEETSASRGGQYEGVVKDYAKLQKLSGVAIPQDIIQSMCSRILEVVRVSKLQVEHFDVIEKKLNVSIPQNCLDASFRKSLKERDVATALEICKRYPSMPIDLVQDAHTYLINEGNLACSMELYVCTGVLPKEDDTRALRSYMDSMEQTKAKS